MPIAHNSLVKAIRNWFPNRVVLISDPLPDGDLNDVYRVEIEGCVYALRVYSSTSTPTTVAEEHLVVRQISQLVPEVCAPEETIAKESFVGYDRRVIALSRFAAGECLDIANRKHRATAATLLSRVHQASDDLHVLVGRTTCPAMFDPDWSTVRKNHWKSAKQNLTAVGIEHSMDIGFMTEILSRAIIEIFSGLAELRVTGLPVTQTDGDFYSRNIKIQDDKVTGLFDWEETRPNWRAAEVARATWEFCGQDDHSLDMAAAIEFIDCYRASGGTIENEELRHFGLLIRADLLAGVLYDLGDDNQRAVDAERGLAMDTHYQAVSVV
jgi:Ser/Thr protein kinase RdoA (MazF antagonist)